MITLLQVYAGSVNQPDEKDIRDDTLIGLEKFNMDWNHVVGLQK